MLFGIGQLKGTKH